MTVRGGRVGKGLVSIMPEAVLGDYGTGASVQHLPGLTDVSWNNTRNMFEDGSMVDSRYRTWTPWKGDKINGLSFKTPLQKHFGSVLRDVLKSALGGRRTATPLSGVANITTAQFEYSGGTPHDWVVITYSTGRIVYRPIATYDAGVAKFAYKLDTISNITTVVNADTFGSGGFSFYEDPDADDSLASLAAEITGAGDPDSQSIVLGGMVPTTIDWGSSPGERRMIGCTFEGTVWNPTVAGVAANPGRPVKHAAPWQLEAYLLTDYDSPGSSPQITRISSYKLNLAPAWGKDLASQTRTGSNGDEFPDSPLSQWRRLKPLGGMELEIIAQYYDPAWLQAFEDEDLFHIGITDYIGAPGTTSFNGDAALSYVPKATLKEPPQQVPNGDVYGTRLLFHIGDERDGGNSAGQMTTALLSKYKLASVRG